MKPSIVILTGAGISAESGLKTTPDRLWVVESTKNYGSPPRILKN